MGCGRDDRGANCRVHKRRKKIVAFQRSNVRDAPHDPVPLDVTHGFKARSRNLTTEVEEPKKRHFKLLPVKNKIARLEIPRQKIEEKSTKAVTALALTALHALRATTNFNAAQLATPGAKETTILVTVRLSSSSSIALQSQRPFFLQIRLTRSHTFIGRISFFFSSPSRLFIFLFPSFWCGSPAAPRYR